FGPQERDEKLGDKLAAEAEGILAWLVEGAFLYAEKGLGDPPAAIAATTSEYHETENPFLRFLREECELTPEARAEKKSFYIRYTKWSEYEGLRVLSKRDVEKQLYERGVRPSKTHSGSLRFYEGVRFWI